MYQLVFLMLMGNMSRILEVRFARIGSNWYFDVDGEHVKNP